MCVCEKKVTSVLFCFCLREQTSAPKAPTQILERPLVLEQPMQCFLECNPVGYWLAAFSIHTPYLREDENYGFWSWRHGKNNW